MEKTVSGLKIEGDWEDVVETSEKVSDALRESVPEEKIKDWEYWRPKNDEDMENDVKDKTVEIACIDESEIENSDNSLITELKEALKGITKSFTRK